MLYVTDSGGVAVRAFVLGSSAPPRVISVGKQPQGLVASPVVQLVYVANFADSSVSVIAAATNTVIKTIVQGIGSDPWPMVAHPDGSKVYVGNGAGAVAVISTATNSVVTTIATGISAAITSLAITPDGSILYANSGYSTQVAVIETSDGTLAATIQLGYNPGGMAVSPSGSQLYVCYYRMVTPPVSGSSVNVFDTSTNEQTASIEVGQLPLSVVFGPGGQCAYVTCEQSCQVNVIDVVQQKATATIPVGNTPVDIAIGPDGQHAYVSSILADGSTSISVIDLSTNQVTGTLPGGAGACEVAVLSVITPPANSKLVTAGLSCTFCPGPNPDHNYNFSACTLSVQNMNPVSYPPSDLSPWVSLDFYASTTNSPSSSEMKPLGDIPLLVDNLNPQASLAVNVAAERKGLFNMSRILMANPTELTVGESYYLYAQVRNDAGSIDTNCGTFSSEPFVYSL